MTGLRLKWHLENHSGLLIIDRHCPTIADLQFIQSYFVNSYRQVNLITEKSEIYQFLKS
jgi:hypothetical protein